MANVGNHHYERTVWKWEIPHGPGLSLRLRHPEIVHVAPDPAGADRHEPSVWIEHAPPRTDADPPTHEVRVWFVGTGHPLPAGLTGIPLGSTGRHVGSCVCGPFVWHVYATTDPIPGAR